MDRIHEALKAILGCDPRKPAGADAEGNPRSQPGYEVLPAGYRALNDKHQSVFIPAARVREALGEAHEIPAEESPINPDEVPLSGPAKRQDGQIQTARVEAEAKPEPAAAEKKKR